MERFQNTRQPDWDWWGKLWPAPGETLRRLGLEPGLSLAEVGSGNGYFALPAAAITDPEPVYAIDLDESLLNELETIADHQGIDNVAPIRDDARSLSDHLPETVDRVLIANTFHGAEDPDELVREGFEVLNSGGQLVVVNWHDRPPERTPVAGASRGPPSELRLSPERTETLVRDALEVDVVRRVDLPPHHYAVVFARPGRE